LVSLQVFKNIEIDYFPDELELLKYIYVLGPLYTSVIYSINSTLIFVGAYYRDPLLLRFIGIVTLLCIIPILILNSIYGYTLVILVGEYMEKAISLDKVKRDQAEHSEEIA
jgi:hypothetical protein